MLLSFLTQASTQYQSLNKVATASTFIEGVNGGVVLRFEDETFSFNRDRTRLRLLADLGYTYELNDWKFIGRARTGLKDRQNVPAITVKRFTDQPQPPSNIFVDRLYFEKSVNENQYIRVGKQPWMLTNATDTFWDRDLNPIGLSWITNGSYPTTMAIVKPLDGETATVGTLVLVQTKIMFNFDSYGELALYPWLVHFNGGNATFANGDTAFDHTSIRMSLVYQYGKFKLGLDLAEGLESQDLNYGDKSAVAQFSFGSLKQQNDFLVHFRLVYTERYSVITEFAQNALAGFATSNIKGFDVRYRQKLTNQLWLGLRYSDVEAIEQETREGKRFRLESGFRF